MITTHRQTPRQGSRMRMIAAVKLANFLELPEEEFSSLVHEIEQDPLFSRLAEPVDPSERVITRQGFPESGDSVACVAPLDEQRAIAGPDLNMDAILSDHHEAMVLARKIGLDKFQSYFLMADEASIPEDAANACGVTPSEAAVINRLVDCISIHSDLSPTTFLPPVAHRGYRKVARFVPGENGQFSIVYTYPHLVKGQYRIDYDKIERLKRLEVLDPRQSRKLTRLLKDLELINTRKDLLSRIIHAIVERQKSYFQSGDTSNLTPFMQKELAAMLSVEPSTVCRALSCRSIEAPWGEEIPLVKLFPSQKNRKRDAVAALLDEHPDHISDRAIAQIAETRYGVHMSRTAVGNYRRELAAPVGWSH